MQYLQKNNLLMLTSTVCMLLFSFALIASAQKMYWIDRRDEEIDRIQRADLDGSNVQDLVAVDYLSNIALDVTGGKMYWTGLDKDTDKIQRANLDGTNVEDLVTTGLSSPDGIALDVTGGKMYWTRPWAIQYANLDGSNVQTIVPGLQKPSGIALDVAGGKMYWNDYEADKIQRANLDGTNVEDLVTTGLSSPDGIALDVTGGKMYWADTGTHKIGCANIDGSNVEDLVTNSVSYPRSIALDIAGDKMYWTEGSRIRRANLDGTNVEALVTTGLRYPEGIALALTLGSTNRSPVGTGMIPVQTLIAGGSAATVNVSSNFSDPDKDALTYTASSSNTAVATVSVSGTTATITPKSAGSATVTVTASDGSLTATQTITVTVESSADVCSRTPQVRDAIVAAVSGVDDCADVTPQQLNSITSLTFRRKQLSTLKGGDFSGLNNLTRLDLEENQFTTLDSNIFSGLNSLTYLSLNTNPITTLPSGVFSGLNNLTDLALEITSLTTLDSNLFSGLNNLTNLYLGQNELSLLPAGVFSGLSNLTGLYLYNNQLSSLPTGVFSGLSNLTTLELHTNPGAPFTLTLKLVRTNNIDPVVPSPATVVVQLVEAAPFDMNISLLVEGGTLSAHTATITRGNTESSTITVTQTRNHPTTISLGAVPEIPHGRGPHESSYTGIQMAMGGSLVLFDTDLNQAPVADGTIPGQILTAGGSAATVNVSSSFSDPDSDTLIYTASSSNTAVATVSVSGTTATIAPKSAGSATVTVTASDGSLTATQTITVTVESSADVCSRTPQVRDAIVAMVSGVNDCADVTAQHLYIIQGLNLASKGITTLKETDFDGLASLTELNLKENQLTTLSADMFGSLNNLARLYLSNNFISDLSPLVANTGLDNGDTVDVRGNPLNYQSINIYIPDLVSRGSNVSFDKRTPQRLEIVSGNDQQGVINMALANPFVVKVTDQDSKAFEGVPVTFTITTGGGALSKTTSTTDASGQAESTLTLGSTTENNTVRVSVSGIQEVTFNAVSNPPETNLLVVEGTITNTDGSSAEAGLSVTVTIDSNHQTVISDSGGEYRVTFFNPIDVVARSWDTVEVQVSRQVTRESAREEVRLSSEQILNQRVTIDLQFSIMEYLLSVPASISLIHVPLKVTLVDGVPKTINSVGDLHDALGGTNAVSFLITYTPAVQRWISYMGSQDKGKDPDKVLTDDLGILAVMKNAVTVRLGGSALGTNGNSTITLYPGPNLVGVPLRDSRITRVSALLALEGIEGNVPMVISNDNGEFKTVEKAEDPGDIPITGGQSFILNAQEAAAVAISGEGWYNDSAMLTAPLVGNANLHSGRTPVLALRGSIVSPIEGWDRMPHLQSESEFQVVVKNLSTGRAVTTITKDLHISRTDKVAWNPDLNGRGGYQVTFVDIETGRAAQIGDSLEISVKSPLPLIGVQPLQYTVTDEDVLRSRVEMPALVAYEIPSETELLANYPNPFNPETWIPYRLAEDAFVTLTIYDSSGQVVRTLDVGHRIAAVYESRSKAIHWDGKNALGEGVASGIYFYTLTAGNYSAARKMLVIK